MKLHGSLFSRSSGYNHIEQSFFSCNNTEQSSGMPTKGKAKKKNGGNGNGKSAAKAANGKGGKAGGKSKKTSRSAKRTGGRSRFAMDIFNEEVMENAYYTCHNIMDVLKCRGFPWPEAQKKKKKGKK